MVSDNKIQLSQLNPPEIVVYCYLKVFYKNDALPLDSRPLVRRSPFEGFYALSFNAYPVIVFAVSAIVNIVVSGATGKFNYRTFRYKAVLNFNSRTYFDLVHSTLLIALGSKHYPWLHSIIAYLFRLCPAEVSSFKVPQKISSKKIIQISVCFRRPLFIHPRRRHVMAALGVHCDYILTR